MPSLILWMDRILHNFKKIGTLVCWYLQANQHSSVGLDRVMSRVRRNRVPRERRGMAIPENGWGSKPFWDPILEVNSPPILVYEKWGLNRMFTGKNDLAFDPYRDDPGKE